MTTVWTDVSKTSGTSWTKLPKVTEDISTEQGSPIGFLLALTYAKTTVAIDHWIRVAKASGTSWTDVPKAT